MTICGLDFGTSNSTIGVVSNGADIMVPLEKDGFSQWQTTLPSALFFSAEIDDISFGRRGIERYTQGEAGRLMRSMKSLLGTSLMAESTRVGNKMLSYDDIVGFFVANLKQKAHSFLQLSASTEVGELESAVLGRPVYFNDSNPELDRAAEAHLAQIARIAGFKHVSFQFEPIAAALDYESKITAEQLALIVDIGGGTSDFTVVRLSPEKHLVSDRQQDFLANHGIHLGGTDFDSRLSIAGVMPEFGLGMPLADRPNLNMPSSFYFDLATWHKIHLLYERSVDRKLQELRLDVSDREKLDRLIELLRLRQGHRLAAMVEQAKIDLSSVEYTDIVLQDLFLTAPEFVLPDCRVERQQLQRSLDADIARIFSVLDETLCQAGIKHHQIDTIFTTGGSTALPMIQACIEDAFPNATRVAGDLYTSVGSGLLVEARKRYL